MNLAELNAEHARLTALRAEKAAALDADERQHRSKWDIGLQDRLRREIAAVDKRVDEVEARRLAVELGGPDPVQPPPQPVDADPWPMVVELAETVGEVVKRLNATIADLRARLEAIEGGGVRYVGNHQRAADYRKGDVVTHAGAMWAALRDAPAGIIPGKPDAAAYWQLARKSTTGAAEPSVVKREKVRVTKHDDKGRVLEFVKEELS